MTSGSTGEFLALCAIAQLFSRPGTPTDQAWIEALAADGDTVAVNSSAVRVAARGDEAWLEQLAALDTSPLSAWLTAPQSRVMSCWVADCVTQGITRRPPH
jgi:hypothetical protein